MTNNRIRLKGAPNTRELGGYETTDGRHVAARRLIRSGDLDKTNRCSRARLVDDYGLRRIVDFRTDAEILEKPMPEIAGVKYHHLPVLEKLTAGITQDNASQKQMLEEIQRKNLQADEFMGGIYLNIAFNEHAHAMYRKFFDILLESEEGAVMFNCSAGKDRTGVGAILVLSALGVKQETILQDYLLSAEMSRGTLIGIRILGWWKHVDKKVIDFLTGVMTVKDSFIQPVFAAIDEKYGSMTGYLHEAIGLTDAEIARLKELYLN